MLFVQKVCVQNVFVSQTLRKGPKRLLFKESCPVAVKKCPIPLNVPLDAFFNCSWVLIYITFTFVSDIHILLDVLVFFSFYASSASSVETEHYGHISALCPIWLFCGHVVSRRVHNLTEYIAFRSPSNPWSLPLSMHTVTFINGLLQLCSLIALTYFPAKQILLSSEGIHALSSVFLFFFFS